MNEHKKQGKNEWIVTNKGKRGEGNNETRESKRSLVPVAFALTLEKTMKTRLERAKK